MVNKVINLQAKVDDTQKTNKTRESAAGLYFNNNSYFSIKNLLLRLIYYFNYNMLFNKQKAQCFYNKKAKFELNEKSFFYTCVKKANIQAHLQL